MPMPIIPKALYPVVPFAPGIPPMLRNLAKIADTATFGLLGASDALSSVIGQPPIPQWGVFDKNGVTVAIADTVLSVEYRNGSRLSDYPLEQGAFASYNKVANPYDVKVRMVCGGDEAGRAVFIAAIEAASRSLDLYTIRTPEVTYQNANIESWDYKRETSNGAYQIIADLYLREVRQTASAAFSAPKSPSAASVVSLGQVQAQPFKLGSGLFGQKIL